MFTPGSSWWGYFENYSWYIRHLLMSVMILSSMSAMKILTLLLPVLASTNEIVTKQTLFGCNGDQVNLHCDPGSDISIVRANYGRFSLSICNSEASGTLRTSCDSSLSSSNILRTRLVCNNVILHISTVDIFCWTIQHLTTLVWGFVLFFKTAQVLLVNK